MHAALTFLSHQPLVFLFLLFALGSALGAIRIRDVQIGPAAVLFTAIGLSALAASQDVNLALPEVVGTLGLVLFTYTVGIGSGPTFFATLSKGWRPVLSLTAVLVAAALLTATVGRALGLTPGTIAGTFAGALTNTPALAAAAERSGDPAGATVGYSISYLFGVLGMLVAAAVVLRRRGPDDGVAPALTNATIRVDRADQPRVRDVVEEHDGDIVVSRLAHGDAAQVQIANEDEVLAPGDLITVVGQEQTVDAVARGLGHRSSQTLNTNGPLLDSRRITLSSRALAGRPLGDLELNERFGAIVSRVRRGDVDMVASDDIVTQLGDRLRVICPANRLREAAAYLGDSERVMSDINPIGLALGLTLGVLLGTVPVPVPGGGFAVGAAAGTLLVGLVFGRLGRVGPLVTGLSRTAASTLSTFGMLAFLAFAGSRAGGSFSTAITSGTGWRVALTGALATGMAATAIVLIGRYLHRIDPTRLAGMVAGTQTQPAILAFANERTAFDNRVALGYALVYPAAMIAKILLAQVLAG